MRRVLIFCLFFSFVALKIFAVGIEPELRTFRQPDGKTFAGRMLGDEFVVFYETAAGYSIAKNAAGFWFYAQIGPDGYLTASAHAVGAANPETAVGEKHRRHAPVIMAAIQQNRNAFHESLSLRAPLKTLQKQAQMISAVPVVYHLAVLLIEFPDVKGTYATGDFRQLFFSEGYTYVSPAAGEPAFGSLRDYYLAMSNGALSVTGQVFNWVMAGQNKAFYETSDQFIAEAVVKSGVNLGGFDGYVVIYAGTVGSASGRLWPRVESGGNKLHYVMSEKWLPQYDFAPIGVHCHEFGHLLGLPDLYDTDFSSPGVGVWELMGSGNYGNGHHERPFHLSTWSKAYLSWLTPTALAAAGMTKLSLSPVATSRQALKLISFESVFLLENRQRLGYDLYLPGAGLLIWHIDERFGQQNVEQRRLVDLEEADGKETSELAGDPFPGSSANTIFNGATVPSSRDYNGKSYVEVRDIRLSGETVSFEVSIDLGTGAGITVNHGGNFPNLFSALEAASTGDTVQVPEGTYAAQNLWLKDGRVLQGKNPATTVLDGQGGTAIKISQAPNAGVIGFTLTHAQIGIALNGAGGLIGFNIFRDLGDGISCANASPSIRNNTIINNSGVGIACFLDSAPVIANNIIVYCSTGILRSGNSSPRILYNDLWKNGTNYLGLSPPANDLAIDPRFVNAFYGDYHLHPASPCIDAGNPDPAFKDPDGTRNDLGALPFNSQYVFSITGIRVNAGGPAYVGGNAVAWAADQPYQPDSWGYIGGEVGATADSIAGSLDDALYQTERRGMQAYLFDLPSGRYRVTLHFCEILWQEAGRRVFDVTLEGRVILEAYDLYAKAGHDHAMSVNFFAEVRDGRLDIQFLPRIGLTQIAALEVVPAQPLFIEAANFAKANALAESQGVAVGDYNNDGYDDIFIATAGRTGLLFRNNGAGVFANMTQEAGLGLSGAARTGAWGDYDNDGDLDLYVVRASAANLLYRNNGEETFTEIGGSAGVDDRGVGVACAWADYDNDGQLDIFVANDGPNVLYRNQGNGVFSNATQTAGLVSSGKSTDAVFGDLNNDGYADLVVTHANNPAPLANFLYLNNRNGTFAKKELGLNGSGTCLGDYDNDGDLDVFMIAATGPFEATKYHLFQNKRDGTFSDVAVFAQLKSAGAATGAGWSDVDHDGRLDLLAFPAETPNVLYHNRGGTFANIADSAGLEDLDLERASAFGDFDLDGDVDIYVTRFGKENLLYQNQSHANHWLTVKTQGVKSNRAGIGARVRVVSGNRVQIRDVQGGSGFQSQSSLAANFGLGTATRFDTLQIKWPSGVVDVYTGLNTVNRILLAVEGKGITVAVSENDETRLSPPSTYGLSRSFPNPFQTTTMIRYALPRNDHVVIKIYNLLGREIRTLVDAAQPAGNHAVVWDGKDETGQPGTNGLYFCLMKTSNGIISRRLLRLK